VHWTWFSKGKKAIEEIYSSPPDLLLVDEILQDIRGLEVVRLVKSENVYRQVPTLICLQEVIPEEVYSSVQFELDDFLLRPVKPQEARARLTLAWYRSTRALDANPLSKLPGNTSIIHRIQDLIDSGQDFALGYLDLDNFKAFNDKYGFSRGDEVLMMTSRVIVNTVRRIAGQEGFVGHIGGDDFVFIVPIQVVEEVCIKIIQNFDSIVPNFYDPKDRNQGYISSVDRQGRQQEFLLMAVSIAVVFNLQGSLTHYAQASQIANSLKKKAKQDPASSYVLDRRRSP
ncbi:MAG: diguanylate cyclase domain-containing protein, partial [Desulfohalobiaceae bacterium]